MPRHQLQQARKSAGLTQKQLARELGVSEDTVAGWERGTNTPRHGFRPRLAKHFNVTLAEVDIMLAEGDGQATNGHAVREWLSVFASSEQVASHLWTWQPVTVPGLLQTLAYATAVERVGGDDHSEENIIERVNARLARQNVLQRTPNPLTFSAVIDESVLKRVTGGSEVMVDQLDHLAKVAELPHIDLRILPLNPATHFAGWGTFTVFAKGNGMPHAACTFDETGVRYHESPYAVQAHMRLFSRLTARALSPSKSNEIVRLTKETHI